MKFLILSVCLIVTARAGTNFNFKCPQPHGQFANPADCDTFYICSFGQAYRMNCPESLSYNPTISVCDWSSNVNCEADKNLEEAASSSRISKFVCPEPSGQFANPADCSSFYLCSFNQAYLMKCPATLNYNSELGICDWSFNVDCSD